MKDDLVPRPEVNKLRGKIINMLVNDFPGKNLMGQTDDIENIVVSAVNEEKEKFKELFREFTMRSKCAFPESEEDVEWWEEGLKPEHIFKFWPLAGISTDKNKE